jgi:hypothetical protein
MNFKSNEEQRHYARMTCDICCTGATNSVPISDNLRIYHGKTFVCPQGHEWYFGKQQKFYKNNDHKDYVIS